MTLPDVVITSEMLWLSALVTALLDLGLVWFLARRTSRMDFRHLQGPIVIAATVFWMSLGLALFALTWESFYAHFLPNPASRTLGRSMLELLLYPIMAWGMWWLAGRLPGNPALNFCLLGGLEAVPEHLWGIYGLGMLERVPFLQGASVASVVGFAVPEYILYWGSVLALALVLHRVHQWWRQRWAMPGTKNP